MANIRVKEYPINVELETDEILKKVAEDALSTIKTMGKGKYPKKHGDYRNSFYIEKKTVGNKTVFFIKNKLDHFDAYINSGHIVWNSPNKKFVRGVFQYNKTQKKANAKLFAELKDIKIKTK